MSRRTVTDADLARRRAETLDAQYRLLFDASPVPVWIADMDTLRFVAVNDAAVRQYGYSRDEFLAMTLEDIRPPEEVPRLRELLARVRDVPVVHAGVWRHRRKDGTMLDVDVTANDLRFGGRRCRMVLCADVTDRLRAERAAEEARRRSDFLAEASRVLASSLDVEATLDNLARLAVSFLGDLCAVHVAEADGGARRVAIACANDETRAVAESLQADHPPRPDDPFGPSLVLRTGRSEFYPEIPHDLVARYAHGDEHLAAIERLAPRSYLCAPLRARGRTIGTITLLCIEPGRRYAASDLALAEDLAARAALAVDNALLLREAQEAVRLREDFVSVASHELKTPLTSLQFQVQSLLRSARRGVLAGTPPERVESMLEAAERQSRRLSRLIDDLLDVSRIQAGRFELRPEEVDLCGLTREVVERMGDELVRAGCALTLRVGDPVTGIWDRLRIEQVVTNLLSNAIKYGRGRPIILEVNGSPEVARLDVEDRGVGIAPDSLDRIFERFERASSGRHYGGLGLGLFIVRQIVDAHGGSVRVRSRPGEGSTFTVELPRSRPTA